MVAKFIILIVFILISAVFSSTETAFTSLSYVHIQELATKKGKRGKIVKKLTDRHDVLLTTILIGNNLVNIGASALATQITIELFGNSAVAAMTGILTLIILVFGEVTPKRLAIMFNDFIALHMARTILFLSWILRPFSWALGLVSTGITRLLKGKKKAKLTLEGILHMLNLGENLGVLERDENRMVRSVFRFNDITVQSVMTHRTDVFSLDMNLTVTDVLDTIVEHGYARIPIYSREPENVVGILLARNVMEALAVKKPDTPLKELMIEPIYVPQSKLINEMFSQFKMEKLNMAIVLDEYGGLAGIVTVEDLIEEILGEVYDEHEIHKEDQIRRLDNGSYLLAGDISLHHLHEGLQIRLKGDKYAKTLGGYILNLIDHIPAEGEQIPISSGTFIIDTISKNRIGRVRYIPGNIRKET